MGLLRLLFSASSVLSAQFTLFLVFYLGVRNCLPLHVGWCVFTAGAKRHDVINDVVTTRAGRSLGAGAGIGLFELRDRFVASGYVVRSVSQRRTGFGQRGRRYG